MAEINQDDYVFTRAPEADIIWVTHPETGGTAQLSLKALPYWAARGWEPCDPPGELDPTRAHMAEAARVAAVVEPAADSASDDVKPTKKSGGAGTTSKGSE
jgi:hypothetical protein